MKNLFYISLFAVSFSLFSCGSNETVEEKTQADEMLKNAEAIAGAADTTSIEAQESASSEVIDSTNATTEKEEIKSEENK